MLNSLKPLAIGAVGVAGTEFVQHAAITSPEDITTFGNLLIQIAIAVATIFGLFKKKSK